jgi:hypothetical protein
MVFYDLRKGIPLDVKTATVSIGEMRVIKEALDSNPLDDGQTCPVQC